MTNSTTAKNIQLALIYKDNYREVRIPTIIPMFSTHNYDWVLDIYLICQELEPKHPEFVMHNCIFPRLFEMGYRELAIEMSYQLGMIIATEDPIDVFEEELD